MTNITLQDSKIGDLLFVHKRFYALHLYNYVWLKAQAIEYILLNHKLPYGFDAELPSPWIEYNIKKDYDIIHYFSDAKMYKIWKVYTDVLSSEFDNTDLKNIKLLKFSSYLDDCM